MSSETVTVVSEESVLGQSIYHCRFIFSEFIRLILPLSVSNNTITCPMPKPMPSGIKLLFRLIGSVKFFSGNVGLMFDYFVHVTGVYPKQAPPTIPVTIYGRNFSPDTAIMFGNEFILTPSIVSSSEITFITPNMFSTDPLNITLIVTCQKYLCCVRKIKLLVFIEVFERLKHFAVFPLILFN